MNVLLDTHVFIWWLENPKLLSKKAVKIIENLDNSVFVSIASFWEIQIKESIGKLKLEGDVFEALDQSQFIPLSISIDHIKELGTLPHVHNDPFDRILISQARAENLMLISRDEKMSQYEVNLIVP